MENLTSDDLLIPWMIAGHTRKRGYTNRTRQTDQQREPHRIQTRYFFLFLFFRLFKDVITKLTGKKEASKSEIYQILKVVQADYDLNPQSDHPLNVLLSLSDESVATFMALAETGQWYTDR